MIPGHNAEKLAVRKVEMLLGKARRMGELGNRMGAPPQGAYQITDVAELSPPVIPGGVGIKP
jgi:hypothetical protein